MKNRFVTVSLLSVVCLGLVGCQWDGGPLIDGTTDHKVHFGKSQSDNEELSLRVKKVLKENASTSMYLLSVSLIKEGTVRVSGYVDSIGTRDEVERVANAVDGVNFVVNFINIR